MTGTLDPPDAEAVIPEGLATKLGKYLMGALAVLAALAQAGVDFDPQTQKAIGAVILVAGAVMGGRYAQAVKKYRRDTPRLEAVLSEGVALQPPTTTAAPSKPTRRASQK